jgi:di/tricarboxylate transporter
MNFFDIFAEPWYQQSAALFILFIGLILFMKNRYRYDVVALFIMIATIVLGILPYEDALANFGHHAVIIVGSMFIMSQALVQSGIVDLIVGRISFLVNRPVLALAFLVVVVTLISGFVNNIGALAMVMPIAIHLAHKSGTPIAFYLLPMAFASHLGGFLTLIGTPRNILVSDFRAEAVGTGFQMFDFLPVGGVIALVGAIFLVIFTWLFQPRTRTNHYTDDGERTYLTEVMLRPNSALVHKTVKQFHTLAKKQVTIVSIFRNRTPLSYADDTLLHEDDIICLKGTEEALAMVTKKYLLQLTGLRALEQFVTNEDDHISIEVVVPLYAKIVGKTWNEISFKDRFGTNFIGLFRPNFTPTNVLSETKLRGNDIILLHGRRESVMEMIHTFALLPIANTSLQLGKPTTVLATFGIIGSAIAIATLQIAPLVVIFLVAVMALIGFNLISLRSAYESVDWPVLVLLAGMITLGDALIASGTAATLSQGILQLSTMVNPIAILILVIVTTTLMSDYINTTAAAVIMAPVAILIAESLGASVDPFLIAVAIGAGCAFQTPVGHESNALVMQKGGYSFRDFIKIGLPLEILIIAISIPLILIVWPLY